MEESNFAGYEKTMFSEHYRYIVDLQEQVKDLTDRMRQLEKQKTNEKELDSKKEIDDINNSPDYPNAIDLADTLVAGTSRLAHRWRNEAQLQYPETDSITSEYLARYLTQNYEIHEGDRLTWKKVIKLLLQRKSFAWLLVPMK